MAKVRTARARTAKARMAKARTATASTGKVRMAKVRMARVQMARVRMAKASTGKALTPASTNRLSSEPHQAAGQVPAVLFLAADPLCFGPHKRDRGRGHAWPHLLPAADVIVGYGRC